MMRRAADVPGTPAAPTCTNGLGLIEGHFGQYEDVTIKKSGDHIAAARDLQNQREKGVTACDRPGETMTITTPGT